MIGAIAQGAFRLAPHVLRVLQRVVPELKNTRNSREGMELLYQAIRKEVLDAKSVGSGTGTEIGKMIMNDIKKNAKVEYKYGRVCIKYRKFKKCMKHKTE